MSTFGSYSGNFGGVLGANGLIYLSPRDAANIGVFDPSTEIFSTHDSVSGGSEAYLGAVVGPDANVYFVPYRSNRIGKLVLGSQEPAYEVAGGVSEAWSSLLSPHFNKY